MFKILCIIPARSGSKGLPNKNILDFKGKPLLSWSIEQALQSKYDMRIIVSTDSEEYQKIANNYGAETPFIRPEEISGDYSSDYECINHCINWLRENENNEYDIVLHLRPTQPCRKVIDIDNCLDLFIENYNDYDSLRTVIPIEKSPFKMYTLEENSLKPLFNSINGINEPYNQARQLLPQCYLHNGYIDILKTELLINKTISGTRIYGYIMSDNNDIDIDTEKDFNNGLK